MFTPRVCARLDRPTLALGGIFGLTLCLTFYAYTSPFGFRTTYASVSNYFSRPGLLLNPTITSIQHSVYSTSKTRRPICPLYDWHDLRYAPIRGTAGNHTGGAIFLALNLFNAQDVVPVFFQELPILLDYLGPSNVYVSIYEDNSSDRTPELLSLLSDLLGALGTPHKVVSGGQNEIPHGSGNRIELLANVRNKALEPLYSGSAASEMLERTNGDSSTHDVFSELLFLNDITFCAADILEVILQKQLQGANQACSVDYMEPVIYDRWVLRDIEGSPFYRRQDLLTFYRLFGLSILSKTLAPPLPSNPTDQERFQNLLPTQVFSCWNGAAIFDAAAFTGPEGIRFRTTHKPSYELELDGEKKPAAPTDRSSECFLSSVDMWKKGRGRIMVVPRASVSYDYKHYQAYRKDYIKPPEHEPGIEWLPQPPELVAMQDYARWGEPERWAPWDEQ